MTSATRDSVIHIVDDDDAVRSALNRLLRSVGYSTAVYRSAAEYLDAETPTALGCLVLDVRMPGTSGLELQEYLKSVNNIMPIVLMTGHGDIQMSVKAMKAGAVDFLPKPFREQDMLDAVSTAVEIHRNRRRGFASASEIRKHYELLTPREKQVFTLAAAGRLNKQIALELGITVITVKVHRASATKKMRARSFAEFARMAEILNLAGHAETV